VSVSTSLVLANPVLRERFDVKHVDTSDHRTGRNIGSWDVTNVRVALGALAALARKLSGEPGIVYLPLSQSTPGVLRDSLLVQLASRRGWKVAAHLRGSEFRQYYAGCNPLLRRWIRSMLARVDSVAVMGESLRGVFFGLVPAERIAVVPNGTPPPRIDGVQRDPNHVLFLSNLRRRKGVVEAVETALLVHKRRPSTRFSFVGAWEDAELERELRSRAQATNGAISFLPPVVGEEKDRLLGSAAVFLFPPVEPEGHPRVVLEALAAGVPVVATDRGAIAETVEDGRSGFVVDEPVPAVLAFQMLVLLDDDRLRTEMSEAARNRYLDRFTQERADETLVEWVARLDCR
jgi:glycosyltransferase involved in cell wall biosynthesis